MTFFDALWAEALRAKTPWLLLVLVVAFTLLRLVEHQKRHRALIFFTVTHVVLIVVSAALSAVNSAFVDDVRIPAYVVGAISLVSAVSVLVFHGLLPRLRVAVPHIVQDVLVATASVITTVVVASRAGANLSGVIATSAVFTAMLGFSLQDTIGNIAGGLGLQLDNSINVGDWIRIGTQPSDINGRVTEIRWRYTAIETRNWETVLVPNRVLMNAQVMVLGRREKQPQLWRRWVHFHVDWRFQPSDVIEVVESAVRGARLDRVSQEPLPNCVLLDMGDSYGKYAVRYWLNDLAADDPTDSAVRTRIFFALERAGMRLAIPASAVFLTEQPEQEAVKTEKQRQRRKQMLEAAGLFKALSATELDELAHGLKYAPFTSGEVVTRQGAEAHWLYLIEEGTASVRVSDGVTEREVAKLTGPSFFGEMSLLTGEPRSATVIALTDVECFRLEKAAFQRVLNQRPELAKEVAAMLSQRKVELMAVREGLDAETAARRRETTEVDLLGKIRSFFGLG